MFKKAFSISAFQAERFIKNRIVTESRSGFKFGPVSRTSFKLVHIWIWPLRQKLDGFLLCFCLFCRPDGVANTCGGRHTLCLPPQQTDCRSATEFFFHSPSSFEETSLAGLTCFPVSLRPT
jgi:hypothetical protein